MDRATDQGAPTHSGAYSNHQEHLVAELRRVSALLTLRVHRHLASSSANARKLVGAHLDEQDIRSLLQAAANPDATFVAPEAKELREEIVKASEQDELL